MRLSRLLAQEQRAFLHRPREAWGDHLAQARAFLGEGLQRADPDRPVLILGAGAGLEIPWRWAPKSAVGWDADPWSRVLTLLRHGRYPEWVFEDLTGGLSALEALAQRTGRLPVSGRRRPADRAARRLAGLLPSLRPEPEALRRWIERRRPGTILVANVLGQIGSVAQRLLEGALGGPALWDEDAEGQTPLVPALDAWTLRTLEVVLDGLSQSGAELWMLHDRAVIWGDPVLSLGPLQEDWVAQLQAPGTLELSDPLCGLDIRGRFKGRTELRFERWLWPVGTGQLHMIEALAYSS